MEEEDLIGFGEFLKDQSPTISTSSDIDKNAGGTDPDVEGFGSFIKDEEVKKKEETQGIQTEEGIPAEPSSPLVSPQAGTGSDSQSSDVSFLPDFNLDAEYINAKQSQAREMSGTELEMSQQDWVKTLQQIDNQQKTQEVEAYKKKVNSAKVDAVLKKVGTGTQNLESGELPKYISTTKDYLADQLSDDSWMKQEYQLDRKIEDLASPENIKTAFLTTGISNNYRVKLNSLKTPEEREAFKQELLANIDEMNRSIGREVSSGDQRLYKQQSLEDLAIEASGLESVYNNTLELKAEKQEFLNKKYGKINKETAELRQQIYENPDMDPEEKAYKEALIKRNESLKQDFINPDGQKIAQELVGDITGDSDQMTFYKLILDRIPENLTAKEKFDMFYIALNEAAKQAGRETGLVDENGNYNTKFSTVFREALGMENIPLSGIKMPSGFSLTESEKDAMSLLGMSNDLANVFFNNNLYRGEEASEGYFSSFMDTIQEAVESTTQGWYQSLIPESYKAAGYGREQAKATSLLNTLSETGLINSTNANPETVKAFVDGVVNPEGISSEDVGTTLGSSLELMAEMGIGSAAIQGTAKAAEAYKYGRKALEYTDKAKKAMEASKYGKIFVPAIEAGIKAEVTSQIRTKESLQEELGFGQFFAGQLGAEIIEGLAKKSGALRLTYLLTKALGVNAGMAADFTGKLMARAIGEITEESIQQIVQAYKKTEDGSSFTQNLKEMFPDMDSVTEFLVLTGVMGAAFGLGGSYNDVRQKLSDGGYDVSKADKIMKEMNTDLSKSVLEATAKETKKKPTVGEATKEAAVAQESKPVAEEATTAIAEEEVATEPVAETTKLVEEKMAEKKTEAVSPTEETTKEGEGVKEVIQDSEYNEFVDKGVVPDQVMNNIAEKVKSGENLSERENAVFTSKTGEINDIISQSEKVTNKEQKNDKENIKGVSSEERVGEKPIETNVKQTTSGETTETGGVLQAQEKVDAQKEEYKAEYRNNSLVEKINNYNKLSDAKKNSKAGVALRTQINQMAADQKRVIQPVDAKGNKIGAFDEAGKKISKRNKFTGDKTPVKEVSSQDKAWAKAEIATNNGFKTSDNNYVQLPGLSYTETKLGAQDIMNGKEDTKAAKKVFEAMSKVRQEGFYEFEQRAGQISQKTQVPIESTGRIQTEEEFLSEEELDQMYSERVAQEEASKEAEKQEEVKKVKLAEVQRRLASKLREGKIRKPGTLLSGTGFEAAFDLALEAAATALEGTATITEAVAKAIDAFKKSDYYKKLLPDQKKKAVSNLESHLNNEFSSLEQDAAEEVEKESIEKVVEPKAEPKKPASNKDTIEGPEGETINVDRSKITQKDPSRTKKLRKHYNKIKDNPDMSPELREILAKDPDSYYDTQTNVWQAGMALELVSAFDEEGGLDTLLEDVEANFAEYGAVGNFILQAAANLYTKQGRIGDAKKAWASKMKLATIAAQILQSMKINMSVDQLEELSKTAMSVAVDLENDIKNYRDSKLSKKVDPSDPNSKTQKDQILEGISDLESAIRIISEGLASGDVEVEKAINKIIGKAPSSQKRTTKKSASEKTEYEKKSAQEREYRRKIREEAKKNRGKLFYSSFGLTVEGIEYVGNLAASYVRSGIISAKALAAKIRKSMKEDFDVDLSNEDIEKSFKKSGIEGLIKQQVQSEAPQKLADKILNELKDKPKSQKDTVETVIRTLFSKAKESIPPRAKTDTDASYREKLVEAMAEQDFSREVWEGAKATIQDVLDVKESLGEITGAEKAQTLKMLDEFFGEKIGEPFSKSLMDKSIKEQIKSDGERIQDIIKEHWTNKEDRGRTLAEKIVADTDLSPSQATELAGMIEKRFSSLIKEHAEKALAKSLGIDELTGAVKLKHGATLKNIIDAVNMGALTEDSYVDAFGKRFGFGTITSGDIAKINGFIYNLTMMPKGSSVRDKELIRMRTYLENLRMQNASTWAKVSSILKEFFIRHILGSLSPVVRSVTGLFMVTPFVFFMEAVKNPKLFVKGISEIGKAPLNLVRKEANSFRVMNALFEGIKKDGWKVFKDAYKEGYVNYDIAQEGFDKGASNGFLDELHNTPWSEVKGPAKKVLKAIETPVSMMVRLLIAGDAVADAAVRPFFALVGAYNKVLIETDGGSSVSEKEFWNMVDERRAATQAHKEAAESQAELELEKMKQAGVSTKDFDMKQRVREIQNASMDEDVKMFAERKAGEIRLGNEPTGSMGALYNAIKKWNKKFPLLTYLLPFVRIPTNALQMATDYTPVGTWRAIIGTGTFVSKSAPENKGLIEKARIGKGFLKPFRKSQADREYVGGELMNDRIDYMIKSTIGTLAGSTIMYLALDGLNKDDDDEENRFQITANGKGNYGDNVILEKGENRHGVKPYHFRMKVPFTNKWTPWIDYRDSPLIMWMTAAGAMSDKILYKNEGEVVSLETLSDKKDVVFSDIGGSAALEALVSFKEQAYMQAVSELISAGDKLDKSSDLFVNKTTGLMTRSIKGTWYPSFYSKLFQYYQTVAQSDVKEKTKASDSIWRNLYESQAKDVFFLDFMLNDYVNNAGEKVQRTVSAIPIVPEAIIKGAQDYWGEYGSDYTPASVALVSKGKELSFQKMFPDVLRGRDFVYKDDPKKEVSLDEKMLFSQAYKAEIGEYVQDNFDKLMKMDNERMMEMIEWKRGLIVDKLLRKDFNYMIRQ